MEDVVELPRRGKVAAKRLFDDHTCAFVAARVGQALDNGRKHVWRNGKVIKRPGRTAKRLSQIAECLLRAVISIDILESCRKYRKRVRVKAAMLLKTLASAGPKVVKPFGRPRHSDDGHIEVTAPDHSLKRREDLLVRQIPGGAKEDKRIRIEVRHFHPSRGFFYVPPELMPHRGQNSIGKIRIAA